MANSNHFDFQGFRSPTTTPIPDELFDGVMHRLTGAELKVVLYICRRTFGFKKHSDAISLNQVASGITTKSGKVLDGGTGLSKRHVQRALKTLEEKKIIKVSRRVDATGLNDINNYSLNIIDAPNGVGTLSPYGRDKKSPGVETPVSTTTNSKQETEKQYDVVVDQLQNFGISDTTAKRFANNYPEEYITDKLALTQWLVDQGSPLVTKNPAGWLRKAIEEDFKPPKDYENPSERKVRSDRAAKISKAEAAQRLLAEQEYQKAKEEATKNVRENHPPEQVGQDGLTTEDAWNLTLKRLKEQLPAPTYQTWIKDTLLVSVAGQAAHVLVPNQLTAQWLERRLYQSVARTLGDVIHQDVDVVFVSNEMAT